MAEWQEMQLGDLVCLEYGAALHAESRTGRGFPVYGSNGVVGYHDMALVPGPGIIVGRKGSVGALQWSGGDFWPIDTTYWVRPTVSLDLHWMREALGVLSLETLDSSTGVPGLNRADAYELPVPVPPLTEQRRIAEILDTLDETIQATERILAKHAGVRARIATDLLAEGSDVAMPEKGKSDRNLNDRPHLGRQQVGMNNRATTKLLNVAESMVDGPFGSDLKTEHYVRDAGVRVVRLANLSEGRYLSEDEAFIEENHAGRLGRHDVRSGDVLVASLGDSTHRPGRACLYPAEFAPGIVKADCFRIRPLGSVDSRFLMEMLNSRSVTSQVRRLAQGVTRDRINLGQLRYVVLQVPPLEAQRQIAEVLDTIDETIEANEEQLGKLRELRSGLAADLLSGRVRTVEA